jgi:NhaP-type Na+/H+ or K+/H+ antiporter
MSLAHIIVALQVMAAALALPTHYIREHWLSVGILLGPILVLAWLVSAWIVYMVLPVTWAEALIIGACVAPTDPVLANSVVKGRFAEQNVPQNVRDLLSCESAANDGVGFPLLLVSLRVLLGASVTDSVAYFVLDQVPRILLSIALGLVVGWIARLALDYARQQGWMDKESFVTYSISIAFALSGALTLLGGNDFIAIFSAGVILSHDEWFQENSGKSMFQDVLEQLVNFAFFLHFGAQVPFTPLAHVQTMWYVLTAVVGVLVLRRLPFVLALLPCIPALSTRKESVYVGWFGPVGVGAVLYAAQAKLWMQDNGFAGNADLVHPVVLWIVTGSVVFHGMTILAFRFGLTGVHALSRVISRNAERWEGTIATLAEQALMIDESDSDG